MLFTLFAVFLFEKTLGAVSPPIQVRVPQATAQATITAVSECQLHSSITQYCMAGATEFRISGDATATASSYTGCHAHAAETWCMAPTGEVQIILAAETAAATAPAATISATSASATSITAISECHLYESSIYCMASTAEYLVRTTVASTATATSDIPAAFTSCHQHDAEIYCVAPNGDDLPISPAGEAGSSTEETASASSGSEGMSCHFHAGVEHCVSAGSSESSSKRSCARVDRDYNIPLRIGLTFVMLATCSLGVFGPIFLGRFLRPNNLFFAMLKQFGTGVIISTAFVHLFTHAHLMFTNECLSEMKYEGTTAAILMAGIFLSFFVEYIGSRLVARHNQPPKEEVAAAAEEEGSALAAPTPRVELVKLYVLEAGIIFHSLLIGLTLVVSGDSFFLTLFAVIVFHQMFEGIALGTCIAALGRTPVKSLLGDAPVPPPTPTITMRKKLCMASAFAVVTPIGMAIGIGVLHQFNGNDPSTIITIGTLDALSAGILVWVGLVEMWAHDWVEPGGAMTNTSPVRTALGMTALVAGMVLMSLLGKWA
ncbi:ZIP zinc transporter-domain-containing protein [Diplogelasinospora grovesii]|uniref:ZIP zinc transporter-domain-containing protein n=1 Tax=Diplogelasinospora grovesii TaxID=303347 RepID=A0AAN6S0Y0_9PEZI|nr:ZIP zinc transporter-domain-containing protein [Diplogelasinospora grovesii]